MKTLLLFLLTTTLFADPYEPLKIPLTDALPFSAEELQIITQPTLPMLYGGREIKEGELSFSVYIGNCTASVVGPRVILTAGHCRSNNSSATFTLKGKRYSGKCKQHPQYSKGSWLNNDFALCLMDADIDTDVYATMDPSDVEKGDTVIMQGYGRGSAGGRLNIGRTKIVRIDDVEYTTDSSVKLGGGDSGGAFLEDTEDLINGPFRVIGINSRASVGGKQSFFNRVNLDRSQEWFKDYAQNVGKICGINFECGEPEKPGPTPTPTPNPKGCTEEALFVKMAEAKTTFFKTMLTECRK